MEIEVAVLKSLISSSTTTSSTGWGQATPRIMMEIEGLRGLVIQVQNPCQLLISVRDESK